MRGDFMDAFGGAFDNAGDVDGDGVDDIIVSAPGYFNGHGEGFFGIYSGDSTLVTSLKPFPATEPIRNSLSQNYPNPFNPSTSIRYALSGRALVSLTVFNTLGQQVATLVNETEEAGYHSVRFDGRGLASGVYFYRLSSGEYVATKRLLLIR